MISIQNLTFNYRKNESLLHDLTFNVPKGSIFGFLGPNGAGKTTTIRLILGLIRPYEGAVFLNNNRVSIDKSAIYEKTGTLIENPSLYLHLTGFENMKIFARYYKPVVDTARINDILSMVDLRDAAQKKAGEYSLGMKQRLGIAIALINDPELLILDEPTNGLDPKGIAEMRNLIIRLNKEYGKTIFISSHILHEIEQMCTHVGIIHHGELLFCGAMEELKSQFFRTPYYRIDCSDPERALTTLQELHNTVVHLQKKVLMVQTSRDTIPEIIALLTRKGILIYECGRIDTTLEQVFLSLTGRGQE